jgi:hypothetical protein
MAYGDFANALNNFRFQQHRAWPDSRLGAVTNNMDRTTPLFTKNEIRDLILSTYPQDDRI